MGRGGFGSEDRCYSVSSARFVSSATVPIAIARLANHEIHMRRRRQSLGPDAVALTTPIPPKIELITAPLKRYLRMPQRYRLASLDWESSVNLTDRAEADRSVKYRRTMPTDAHPTSRVRAADELKQAALEQFATVGFAATSLQHIADHAGYSKSSVLYHYASKEALLEAAIEPAISQFEAVLDDFLAGGRSGRRHRLVDRIVDLLLENRQAVHVFIIQGPSLSELPIIARANAAVRRLAEAISEERESVTDQVRFGVALGGAAFLLTAGRAFVDEDQLPTDDELRAALQAVLADLLAPADRRTSPITD